jgi:phosphodiesterase/alkaline phosphatase D-like protein
MHQRIGIRILLLTLVVSGVAHAQAVNITHGPMLGHVTADGISIWARTSKPGQFRVQYGRMPDRLDQESEATTTTADWDNTGWVRLNGLNPNTRYYYRPVTSGDAGREGSFLTLPLRSYRDAITNPRGLFNFRFQLGSCADQRPVGGTGPGLPTYGTMLKQLPGSIHFSIMNGDWLYEDKREFTVENWREQTGSQNAPLPKILELAPSIVGGGKLQVLPERGEPCSLAPGVPSYYTPDDHEI